ncbi:MBOAT family protein [Fusobacterium mortiferum]|uniref:MBOAT family protein n=1 Tax=Fusobacterium mortiferum TaxID=850 RepID=A0A414PMJ0_FUSMR|nr:MBOAT family protein [Fusobacterium mortiferum]RHF69805.1 MBOAT family protein [Fusobacterium mortiferum]
MLFNSYEFIFLFLPITLIIYFWLNKYNKNRLAKAWLVIASLYFYSYFHKSYLILITISILVNYYIGQKLSNDKYNIIQRKIFLIIGIVFNLGGLGYFKYYDFFVSNINIVLGTNLPLLHILLPLGISFFTFQQLSFVIDSYKRYHLSYDFLDYCLFVTFFPQLIAGPIVLPTEMLSQFEAEENKKINWENMNKGLYVFSIGLAKKVIIADTIANFANAGFDMMNKLNFIEAWLTSISYTLQLYFDFSGYCDMAMGIGLMFNIILPANFNSPYKSTNIQEFWKRWHMTLGRFMTNYLYIPLGGNRKGEVKTLRNLFIVFLASGIWHGAGWNFVIWGILHGICILIHRIWKNSGRKLNKIVGWLITMNLVNIFWIFFRAETVSSAMKVIKGMFDINNFYYISVNMNKVGEITKFYREIINETSYLGNKMDILILLISTIIIFEKNTQKKLIKFEPRYKYLVITLVNLNLSLLLLERVKVFLYFNF